MKTLKMTKSLPVMRQLLIASCVLGFLACMAEGDRILILPLSFTSHIKQFHIIGEELASRGHDVYMAVIETHPYNHLFMNSKVKLIIHRSFQVDLYTMDHDDKMAFIGHMLEHGDMIRSFREFSLLEHWSMCESPLSDLEFIEQLKSLNFDLAIVDIFVLARCLLIIPYNLGIPYIGSASPNEPWLSRAPIIPSYSPSNLLGQHYTDRMNFWERLNNLRQTVDWIASPRIHVLSDDRLATFIKKNEEGNVLSLNEISGKCLLFLIELDPLIDYPRTMMPNEINTGGITSKPAKPLPADLQDFMDSAAEHGVILFTFGSFINNVHPAIEALCKDVFRNIKQKVIWKYDTALQGDMPSNVKVLDWLPQNDILGHPNIRLFITHCGNNGQMESLYHGVPMIGLPLFGDQFHNCKRIAHHGYGICLLSKHLTTETLSQSIDKVINNSSYRENIQKASEMFKDRPMSPVQKAVYWIEHVMKYGGAHLHAHALDMAWYEYLMLDILAFLLLTIALSVAFVSCLIYYCLRCYRGRHAKMN